MQPTLDSTCFKNTGVYVILVI